MRVVLDINAVVSALLFSGISSKLVSLWQKGSITPLLSLTRKWSSQKGRLRVVQRDPSDNKFLECAVAGNARVIISGDKDLLSLRRYRQIRIQSPAQFLADNPGL